MKNTKLPMYPGKESSHYVVQQIFFFFYDFFFLDDFFVLFVCFLIIYSYAFKGNGKTSCTLAVL